jgi:hypothetical protein
MPRKRKSRDTRFSDYGSFFGMLSGGGTAKIKRDDDRDASEIAAGRDLEGQDSDVDSQGYADRQAQVFLPKQSSFEAKLLGAGRAKFSPLGATEILKEEVGSDVAGIWDSLENVRTAHKATDHYHNEKVMKEFYGAVGKRQDPNSMSVEQAISGANLRTEILRMAVDVPSPDAHHVIKRMRSKFNARVKAAMAADDQQELIQLSVEIADYLNMERNENYREPNREGDVDAEDILKRVLAKDKAKRGEIKEGNATAGEVETEDPQKRGYSPGAKDAMKVMGRDHVFSNVEHVESEPITLSAAVSMVLDETRGSWDKEQGKFKGVPSRDIWRLGMFGDTAVFEENKKTRGKVAIMVDMSGSMGCPCDQCDQGRGRGWHASLPASQGGHYRNAAWLAWQAAGAIMKAFPESDVYSYSSGRGGRCAATILTNQTGNQPTHMSVGYKMGGGTPTCTGALYLKQVITSDIGASAAVLITDGYPNIADCTAAVNKGFMRDGLRFASVLIGHDLRNMDTIFPSESSVQISGEDELANLQQTMRFLGEVRQ